MGRIAIMVDAGYLLTASSELATGRQLKRRLIRLAADEVVLALVEAASQSEPGDELLRVYWYDAAIHADRLTEEQTQIAMKRSCKLRLGTLNRHGGQKCVDTLMVMYILALARNRAVSSLLVVSGDDDLRPALEAAQELGVRVHLLGVKPLPGENNLSERLKRECDSFREWTEEHVVQFILAADAAEPGARAPAPNGGAREPGINGAAPQAPAPGQPIPPEMLVDAVTFAIEGATDEELRAVLQHSGTDAPFIPGSIDRRLLGRFGGNFARALTEDEKRAMRRAFAAKVHHLLGQSPRSV